MICNVNDVFTKYSKDKTIIGLFEERAIINPEAIAIEYDNGKLTYSELDEKANRLADVLKTYNIGPGDFVGLMLRRSPELIICLLAILKNGGAYVPLNLADPEKRIISNIITARIKYLITNTDHNL